MVIIYVHGVKPHTTMMAAGSRLPGSSHEFFLFSATFQTHLFKHTFSNTPFQVFEQAVGPGVLQTFSTCAVKH